MMVRTKPTGRIGLALLACVALFPATMFAQETTGTVAGLVKDTTNAVLPGVTVEASSPALIEKVRSTVTDDNGLYRIVGLRPGIYTVTFSLSGFRTVRREGIEVSAAVTATINADLPVGSIEETVIVSGQAPLVDVQNTTAQRTLTRTELDELPTGRHYSTYAVLIPGVTMTGSQDLGGSSGNRLPTLAIHGSKAAEMQHIFDGMKTSNLWQFGGGVGTSWVLNNAMVQEISIETNGNGADVEVSGVSVNQIPKSGGNTFAGSFFSSYIPGEWQANNLDDELRKLGGTSAETTKRAWNVTPAIGGPIKRDKLWFFFSYANWGSTTRPTSAYHDLNLNDFVFTPDLSRPAENPNWYRTQNLRLTWQASQSHRFSLYGDRVRICGGCAVSLSATRPYEASTRFLSPENSIFMGTWSWTVGGRLLIDAGQTYKPEFWTYNPQSEVPLDRPSYRDSNSGVVFSAPPVGSHQSMKTRAHNGRFAVSYVTGSHQLKVGSQWYTGYRIRSTFARDDRSFVFNNGTPNSVTFHSTPLVSRDDLKLNLGLFVQEQWTHKRLTLNAGLRFDHLNTYVPEQHKGPTKYVPQSFDFARIDNVPNWNDVSPRLGVSYDLFGTGRTALKWSLGRYVESVATSVSEVVNPLNSTVGRDNTRTWNDTNKDFIPQESELLPGNNANFGKAIVPIRYAPNTVEGWGTRGRNWESMVGIVHEVVPGLSAAVGYFRRDVSNFRVTDNLLVAPTDYDTYCITAPANPRLPGGGGYQVCGLADLKLTKPFGANDNVITRAEAFGEQTQTFDGIDVNLQARLPGGLTFQGGTATGRTKTNSCFTVDSPQDLLNCDITPPFHTQLKISAIYPLPWWGLKTSGTFQSVPGAEILASYAVPVADIVPSLGRALAGGARTATVPLIKPGTVYGDRLNQVDLRIAKDLSVRRTSVQVQFDLYNAFNGNTVLNQNNTFGSLWLQPTSILQGRLAKFGLQVSF